MSMDSFVSSVGSEMQTVKTDSTQKAKAVVHSEKMAEKTVKESVQQQGKTVVAGQKTATSENKNKTEQQEMLRAEDMELILGKEKEPAKSSIDSAISEMNAQLKPTKTRCAYNYDEETKRITIKMYDEESDELIREIPPEKSLEVLKRIWEIAGIIIDEKR